MAKFTAPVDLKIKWNGLEISGATGATHRIPDALVEEFGADIEPRIPGGVTWITQDETSSIPALPLAQSDVTNLTTDLAAKYDKSGGTISGAVTVTGALVAQASVSTPSVTATAAYFKGRPWYDVRAYGALGDGSTDDATAFGSAFTAAGAAGGTVFVPPGTYKVNTPLTVPDLVSLRLEAGATIRAGAAMSALISTSATTVIKDQYIAGGTIDAAGLASTGVFLRRFTNYRVEDTLILSAVVNGLKIGDNAQSNRAAEGVVHAVHISRPSTSAMPASSVGILMENSGDHSISQVVINGYDIGIDAGTSGSNVFHDVHVWTDPVIGSPNKGFRDYGNNNAYFGCYADTPFLYGWHLGGFNTILVGCKVAMASNYGVDNTTIGVKYEQADPYGALLGCIFNGSSSYRLAADIESTSYSTIAILGSQTNANLVATRSTTARATSLSVSGTITAGTLSATGNIVFSGSDVRVKRGAAGQLDIDSNGTTSPTLVRATATAGQRNSYALYITGEVTDRVRVWGDSTLAGIEFGPGSAARDTNLYRSAANVLKTDDQFAATDGITTKVVAGAVSDGSFTATPPSGTIAIDTTSSRLYVRVGSTWKSVALA